MYFWQRSHSQLTQGFTLCLHSIRRTAVPSSCQDSLSNFGCHSSLSCSWQTTNTATEFLNLCHLNLWNQLKYTHSANISMHMQYMQFHYQPYIYYLVIGQNKKNIKSPLVRKCYLAVLCRHVICFSEELNYEQSSCSVPMDRSRCCN